MAPAYETVARYPRFHLGGYRAREIVRRRAEGLPEPGNTLCLSVASVWEMLIKQQLGKLTLDIALKEMLDLQQEINQLRVLPIELSID